MIKRITLLSIVFSSYVTAGTADLSIELEFNEVGGIVVERQGEFTASITNLGPDIAAADAAIPLPISMQSSIIRDNGSFTPDVQFAAGAQNNNQECFFILIIGDPPPGGSVSYAYDIDIPPLAVNETIECFGIYSTHFESETRDVTWEVQNTFDTDPVSSNNTQTVTFGFPPRSVPINSLFFLLGLFLLLLLFGRNLIKSKA